MSFGTRRAPNFIFRILPAPVTVRRLDPFFTIHWIHETLSLTWLTRRLCALWIFCILGRFIENKIAQNLSRDYSSHRTCNRDPSLNTTFY